MDNEAVEFDLSALLNTAVEEFSDDEQDNPVEILMPFLKQFGFINRCTTSKDVTHIDLKELSIRWNLKIKDRKTHKDKNFDQLLSMLTDHLKAATSHGAPGKPAAESHHHNHGNKKSPFELGVSASADDIKIPKKRTKLRNFFGLPDYAYMSNSDALVYKARKTIVEQKERHHQEEEEEVVQVAKPTNAATSATKVQNQSMIAAQRKVSHALLTMVNNETMSIHFIHKGGVEAIIKLIGESTDHEVLITCMECLLAATLVPDYCKVLTEKYILSNLQGLLEKADQDIYLKIAQVITNLSYQDNLGEVLVLGGIVGIVQNLFGASQKYDIYYYCMLTMNNIGPVLQGPEAELALKILMSCTKRIDVARNYQNACFAIDIFVNFSRLLQYATLLCEEGVLPLFIHTLEAYMTLDMMGKICEGFVNLSCTRKNRREIASSGIAGHLDKIFTMGSPGMRAHILSMVGNLLSSGFFHDKIARDDAIKPMMSDMLDPAQPKQFTAVAFVISQLAQVQTSAIVMVRCNAIQIILGMLREAPVESQTYLWTLLAALSQQPIFFEKMVCERGLVLEMYKEVLNENSKQIELVVQLAYNLSIHENLSDWLAQDLVEMFVELLKTIFSNSPYPLKATAISTLINFCTNCKSSRPTLIGVDLVDIFEEVGIEDAVMNVKYAAILNIVSNEENLCIKLLEMGAQKFLVAIQGSITTMPSGTVVKGKQPSVGAITGDLGRALTAATLHNLSLRRAILGPGVLLTLMTLLRNNKTLRVLHCVRTLARVSVHPKAKTALTKEKRIIPALTAIMRSGCEEADRVQHYCALTICNTLASQVAKDIMTELCSSGAITDLVVCTLLRINSVYTKESLGKALFNLMSRVEFREEMVVKLDVLTAMLELAKIENIELLELCIRSVYNITCETKNYIPKLKDLKVANILIARVTSSPLILGAKATTAVKFLCGMAIANVSFHDELAEDLVFDKKVSQAAEAIFKLNSDEATYCAAVLLVNLSKLSDAKNLADSLAIPLLVRIIERGPVNCIQMAVVALTNFSMEQVFFDQIVEEAIPSIIKVLSAPSMHDKIKTDCLQFVYNITTMHPPSWVTAVESETTAALWRLLKSQGSTADGNEARLYRIGRIVKEICQAGAKDEKVLKKLLADGVMSIILKLAKIELPELKFDLACAIYSLSQSPDPLKVLQWDGVDILFWLTLHDCLNFMDPIRRNVCRALRNFSASGTNGAGSMALAKEERTMTVLRALGNSTVEDVQWQVSGAMYNMLGVPESQDGLINRGAVGLLLELAAGGYTSVRHVCSACLHMCPSDAMPDLSDPAALSLVLCLLEVDGEKFGELAEMARDEIPYMLGALHRTSSYVPDAPTFTASWVCIACEVDNVFTSALVEFPSGVHKEVCEYIGGYVVCLEGYSSIMLLPYSIPSGALGP